MKLTINITTGVTSLEAKSTHAIFLRHDVGLTFAEKITLLFTGKIAVFTKIEIDNPPPLKQITIDGYIGRDAVKVITKDNEFLHTLSKAKGNSKESDTVR